MQLPTLAKSWHHKSILNWIVPLTLALLVILLWLPFGWEVGFTLDDWILFHQVDQGNAMSAASATRLFAPIPFMLAYSLNPGHFSAINLFLALLLFVKGILCYAVLRRLNGAAPLAFAIAVLTILLPADRGVFYMGALTIQFALVSYLLAIYLLLAYWHRKRLSALLGMWIALLGSVGIYELVYPLIVVTPLILLWFHHRIDRRFIRVALLWYVIPLVNAIWYVFIVLNFPRAFAYQDSLSSHPSIPEMLTSLLNIYRRHFIDSWWTGGSSLNSAYVLLSVTTGALVFAVALVLARRDRFKAVPRLSIILIIAGLVIVGLGTALYLPTSLRDETLRTYYFSSVGAAVTLAALLWRITPRQLVFAALVGGLAGVAVLRLLDQHQRFYDTSERQQAALTELVRVLPAPAPSSGIVVVDETPDAAFSNLIYFPPYLEYMLPTLYNDYSLEAELCLPGDFGYGEQDRCRFTDDGMQIESWRTFTFVRSYGQLIFVRYDGTFSLVDDLTPYAGSPIPQYQPERRYLPGSSLPSRVADLFGS